jgi:hypothetical protein
MLSPERALPLRAGPLRIGGVPESGRGLVNRIYGPWMLFPGPG